MSEPSKAKDSKDAKAEGAAAPKAPRGNGLLVVLVAINTLVTAGGAAFTFLHANAAPAAKSHAKGGDKGGEKDGGEKGGEKDEGEAKGEEKAEEKDEPEEKAEKESEGEGKKGEGGESLTTSQMMRVEDLVVHLRNPEVDRYARLEIDIEVDTSNALQRLESRRPAVRDAVISYMSERTYEELRGADGIANLKKALRERIEPLAPHHVRGLFVTSFVVQ